jgi:hypothetical protein
VARKGEVEAAALRALNHCKVARPYVKNVHGKRPPSCSMRPSARRWPPSST